MPSLYIKKGFNPISGRNKFKTPNHQALAHGIPPKPYAYEKRGFNPAVLSNLIPIQRKVNGKSQSDKRGAHKEDRDEKGKLDRLLRNSERNAKEVPKCEGRSPIESERAKCEK